MRHEKKAPPGAKEGTERAKAAVWGG